eukprot:3934372-Rhodomonas_salina.1
MDATWPMLNAALLTRPISDGASALPCPTGVLEGREMRSGSSNPRWDADRSLVRASLACRRCGCQKCWTTC